MSTKCLHLQVQQNLHDAVTEYAKLKQQLEKNTAVINLLQHLQEVMLLGFCVCLEDFLTIKLDLCLKECAVCLVM